MDLDLRKLRYFVAVADRLHFGRAADELHIAQPVLSRQIRALEHDLGTPLLARDSHGVALTDAGRQSGGGLGRRQPNQGAQQAGCSVMSTCIAGRPRRHVRARSGPAAAS